MDNQPINIPPAPLGQNTGTTPPPTQPVAPQPVLQTPNNSLTDNKFLFLGLGAVVGLILGLVVGMLLFGGNSKYSDYVIDVYKLEHGDDFKTALENDIESFELLSELETESNSNSSESVNSAAFDAERMTDINALHAQLEVYEARNGIYPLERNVENASWVEDNLLGLDTEALIDPNGLAIGETGCDYIYIAYDCEADGCATYSLSARLDSGELFTKNALIY